MTARVRLRGFATWLAISALLLAPAAHAQVSASDATLAAPAPPAVTGPVPTSWPDPAPGSVAATSWVLVEAETGQRLAEHAPDVARPVASTVKILTALTVISRVDLDEPVTVGDEVLVGGASVGLEPGDTWTVADLLEAMLVRSGNDATEALAAHVAGDRAAFVELMRADARALGLDAVVIGSPSGLGDENLLTALDLATLARAALAEPDLRPFFTLEEITLPDAEPAANRNLLLGAYPGATGIKTGFTLAAGNSLVASARRDGRELVAVVLDAGDDPARFEQAAALLDLGFDQFVRRTVTTRLELAVAGGWRGFAAPDTPLTVPTTLDPAVRVAVPTRVPDGAIDAEVVVGEDAVTATLLQPQEAPQTEIPDTQAGRLGAALVDGIHASLRAANDAGALR